MLVIWLNVLRSANNWIIRANKKSPKICNISAHCGLVPNGFTTEYGVEKVIKIIFFSCNKLIKGPSKNNFYIAY